MLFNSLTFFAFLAIVLAIDRTLADWTARKRVLLAASYLFYAAWNPPYVAILAFSTTMDWWLARRLDRTEAPRTRKALLALSIAANLALLGFFKYGGFLLENFQRLAAAAGIAYVPPEWNIVLPVGISFYTFASLSYTIDVYRRQLRADASLADYALFVAFFPHLVAGPIVRASLLLPQIVQPRRADRDQVGWGLCLVVLGLFAKCVLADATFAPVSDQVFGAPAVQSARDAWAGVLAFSWQIYFDFGGYSLCAIGLALMFGFEFPDNFRAPYAAIGFSDFWRRWHISLSTWLRDYLYVPLGGNRGTRLRTGRNLMLTMLLGGLWHGASWMYVLWGALHGALLVIERGARDAGWRLPRRLATPAWLVTFAVVTLVWIPFRAPTAELASSVLTQLFRPGAAGMAFDAGSPHLVLALTPLLLLGQRWLRERSIEDAFGRLPTAAQALLVGACLVSIYLCSGGDERAFIYFQF